MCQPWTLRPAGGAIHQSASGTANAASAPMTRDRVGALLRARVERERSRFLELRRADERALPTIERVGE